MGENQNILEYSVELLEGTDHIEAAEIETLDGRVISVTVPTLSIPEIITVFHKAGFKTIEELETVRKAVQSKKGTTSLAKMAKATPKLTKIFKMFNLAALLVLKFNDERTTEAHLTAFKPASLSMLGQRALAQAGFGPGLAQFFRPGRT